MSVKEAGARPGPLSAIASSMASVLSDSSMTTASLKSGIAWRICMQME